MGAQVRGTQRLPARARDSHERGSGGSRGPEGARPQWGRGEVQLHLGAAVCASQCPGHRATALALSERGLQRGPGRGPGGARWGGCQVPLRGRPGAAEGAVERGVPGVGAPPPQRPTVRLLVGPRHLQAASRAMIPTLRRVLHRRQYPQRYVQLARLLANHALNRAALLVKQQDDFPALVRHAAIRVPYYSIGRRRLLRACRDSFCTSFHEHHLESGPVH